MAVRRQERRARHINVQDKLASSLSAGKESIEKGRSEFRWTAYGVDERLITLKRSRYKLQDP